MPAEWANVHNFNCETRHRFLEDVLLMMNLSKTSKASEGIDLSANTSTSLPS
jgi:hypothetical protein